MLHIVHLIQRRLDGKPYRAALPLVAMSLTALLAGLLMLAR